MDLQNTKVILSKITPVLLSFLTSRCGKVITDESGTNTILPGKDTNMHLFVSGLLRKVFISKTQHCQSNEMKWVCALPKNSIIF